MANEGGNRFSTFSNASMLSRSTPTPQHADQLSTQTLLNAVHTSYSASKPYPLDASTTLVVNTSLGAASLGPDGRVEGIVDSELAQRAWEHARRRAEDGCIVLGSLHHCSPSLFVPFLSRIPIAIPSTFFTALSALQPFFNCVTPENPSTPRYSSFAATFTLSLSGNLTAATLSLSTSPLDTRRGLLRIPPYSGYRAFDVFYYLLSSASTAAEREFLGLRNPSSYNLLKKSGTYSPPAYLPTADDAAAAEEFRAALKAIGVVGSARRDLLSVLASILKLGNTLDYMIDADQVEEICEDVAGLLGLEPETLHRLETTEDRESLIGGLYECLVDWVLTRANGAIAREIATNGKTRSSSRSSSPQIGALTPMTSDDESDTASITVLDVPNTQLARAVSLRNIFDDSEGINAEMKNDGVNVAPTGQSVLMAMKSAIDSSEADLGILDGHDGRQREVERDRCESILEQIGQDSEEDSFIRRILYPSAGQGLGLHRVNRFDLPILVGSSRVWFHLCLHPTSDMSETMNSPGLPWSAGPISQQLRDWRLPEWANRRNRVIDFTADFDHDEFCTRYSRLGCQEGREGIESFVMERGWSNGEVTIGTERVWIRESAWWQAETMLDMLPAEQERQESMMGGAYQVQNPQYGSGYFGSPFGDNAALQDSHENLLQRNQSSATFGNRSAVGARSLAPTAAMTMGTVSRGDYGLGAKGDAKIYVNDLDPEIGDPKSIEQKTMTTTRRMWLTLVWALTFWIPSFVLRYVGRMKRPDVRMAWREKVVLVALIFLLNAVVVFYIIEFGRLLCPNLNKAWNNQQVSYHQGTNDAYVSVAGKVYDITKFWRLDHSHIEGVPVNSELMEPLLGQNVDYLFPRPLSSGCAPLVQDANLGLTFNVSAQDANVASAFRHTSGKLSAYPGTDLANQQWFWVTFLPRMKEYYKGQLVYHTKDVQSTGTNEQKPWFVLNNKIYDLSDYFYTQGLQPGYDTFHFLGEDFENEVQSNPGSDISSWWKNFKVNNSTGAQHIQNCLDNVFYIGDTDFRDTAKCQVNNYILLAFTIILCAVILTKFLSALQLGSKKRPSPQDKFVICQVPAYTEGEDQLRKGLDSLTALAYDNKRKLICVICDGMIVGGGNDRPTPKIVLDILGVDPKIDPPALPFKSVGSSSAQLNYGKVYSGLYEYEGNVVPYIVVVKVGKESEQAKSKPGNRGKRDSQVLLMNFLNRVHHRAPMSPLELEMFHQINNIIGVDPELYEYLFMVDADTTVKEDSLNRLVSACAHDAKIAGICGETSLENEERSWWTMIQVYEYYISHHLAKAFESLFGSVTCLPGCFSMYRLRTVDKGKPLIISDKVIGEYSFNDVDTLHKKNLLALGEDRYLTTLMTKHFPAMKYKFVPDAYAKTAAPDTWSVLLSQRRRWINSTIHNLAELVLLKDLCGFCCFSMRFVVFIDLFGTLILPATCTYLVYLIYRVASHTGQFPIISIIIIGAVYGLQAIIFIIKRQWQHVGWMLIYICAYPVYSLILPVYSFWKQDDFSWGNTRIVIGEKGNKQLVAIEDEGFDPRSIPLQLWEEYALTNNLPGRRGLGTVAGSEKAYGGYDDAGYEMDDVRSVYSAKPASTVLTGFKSHGGNFYMPPQSPAFTSTQMPPMQHRQSQYSNLSGSGMLPRYTDSPGPMMSDVQQQIQQRTPTPGGSIYNMMNQSDQALSRAGQASPYGFQNMAQQSPRFQSTDNLMGNGSPSPQFNSRPSGFGGSSAGFNISRPPSTVNFQQHMNGRGEVSDQQIIETIQACLMSVDLDSVTKKQLKALAEQRLQAQLSNERRAFLDRQIDAELANM
ncbi:MAG: hypothetical protein M1828_001177 [Chrysothrix sp. TS-e1954]|nr:MAG: hypothetical protein M1828_001177 [Chrysothrix sp. TS-e1954]